jgi:beta-glucanase (GH16 family)
MKHAALLAAAALSVAGALRASAQLPAGNWGLRFADEFTGQGGDAGTNLDPVKWSTAYPWGRTHNYPAYIRDENITVSGGTLNLQAKRESYGGQPYTSGAINSSGKFNFTNGYVEARMKLPAFLGAWPAFWMLQDGWPPELDVMEARFRSDYDAATNSYLGYGDMYSYVGTYHWGADYTQHQSAGTGFKYPGGNLTDAFHNYGTLWASDHVTFYFDGRDMGSVWSSAANIAQMRNMYLILNLGVGGWPGDPPGWEGMGPAFQTDWVRVWQQTPGTTQSNWTKAANGNQNWDDAANWSAGVPQLASQAAFLGPVNATDVRLDWAGNKVIGTLTFQAATNYDVGWPDDSLMLAAPLGQSRAYVNGYYQSGQGRMSISSRVELYSDVSVRNWLDNPITFNGAIIGTGEFSAEQGGVVLNGPATYTGATRVKDNGRLTINGAVGGTSNLFVNTGTATISTTGSVTTSAYASIGQNAGDVATLNLEGGAQLTVNGDLNVADVAATGTLNIAGAAQLKARTLYVGKFGAASGTVTQTGGAVTGLPGGGDWRVGGATSADGAAVGAYNLQGGSVGTSANVQIGAYGRGTFTQTGGGVNVGGYLAIGRFAGGSGPMTRPSATER